MGLGGGSGFCEIAWIGGLQPEAHHFFAAGLAPAQDFGRIGIEGIVFGIVEVSGDNQLGTFGKQQWFFQEVDLLPAEIVVRHVKQEFAAAVGKERFSAHALAAEVHVRGVGERENVFGECGAGGDSVVVVIGRNKEKVIPHFVLLDFVMNRF